MGDISMGKKSSCDSCTNYVYDDEYDCYSCMVDLDEDDTARYMRSNFECPYYSLDDEYKVVRHQM